MLQAIVWPYNVYSESIANIFPISNILQSRNVAQNNATVKDTAGHWLRNTVIPFAGSEHDI